MIRKRLTVACEVVPWTLDADLLETQHQVANELVPALQTKELVLPIRLVEEDDVERDREILHNLAELGEDLIPEFSFLGLHKFQQSLSKGVDLLDCRAKFDNDRDGLGESTAAPLVQDEERVEVAVWGLDDVAFHLFELGVEEGYLLDVVVIPCQGFAGVAVNRDTVTDVKRMSRKKTLAR